MLNNNYPSKKKMKLLIKQLKTENNIKTHQAYEMLSQQFGIPTWREFKPKLEDFWASQTSSSKVCPSAIDDKNVELINK